MIISSRSICEFFLKPCLENSLLWRFREFYYWDSYWIVRGLLISEMHSTVKGMLHNFLDMVDIYGMVPNGGRIYYERRSQPPLLIAMVDAYVTATDDVQFLRDHIHLLQKELYC